MIYLITYLKHLQLFLKKFDFIVIITKNVFIKDFYNSLKLLIKFQINKPRYNKNS